MKNIAVGQKVFIVSGGGWVDYGSAASTSYGTITRFNTNSVYVQKESSEQELRFEKRTRVCKDYFGGRSTLYLDEDVYWDKIAKQEELLDLKKELTHIISTLDIDKLREIKTFLNKDKGD